MIVEPEVELVASVALLTVRTPAADTVSALLEPIVVTPEDEARPTVPDASNVPFTSIAVAVKSISLPPAILRVEPLLDILSPPLS